MKLHKQHNYGKPLFTVVQHACKTPYPELLNSIGTRWSGKSVYVFPHKPLFLTVRRWLFDERVPSPYGCQPVGL